MSFRKNKNKKRTLKKLIHLQGGADEIQDGNIKRAILERINYFGENDNTDDVFNKLKQIDETLLPDIIKTKQKRLVFSDCHGEVVSDGDFKTIPNNVILCFLSPLGDINVVYEQTPKFKTFNQRLMSIKPDEFNNIFEFRSRLREISLEVEYNLSEAISIYNCFLNSVWYYPGQKYTDVRLNISKKDNVKYRDDIYFNTYNINISPDGKKVNFFPNPYIFQDDRGGNSIKGALGSKSSLNDTLSDFLNKFKKDTGHINLVIMNCCRNISTQFIDNYQLIYENEIAHYHYNILLDQKLKSGTILPKGQIFKPSCYNLSHKYEVIIYYLVKKTALLSQDLETYHSYYGKIPSLQVLFGETIDKSKMNKHNIRYLLHMPIKKILLFFVKYNSNLDLRKTIVDVLLKNNYFIMMMERFVNYLHCLADKIYLIQNNIAYTELQNLLQFLSLLLDGKKKMIGYIGLRTIKFLNLKTKIIEILDKLSAKSQTGKISLIGKKLELTDIQTLPDEEIDFLIAKEKCTSLYLGPHEYSNIKEIQVQDTQKFRYAINLFDRFPGLEKLSFHIFEELNDAIRIRNTNLRSLQIKGYNRINNLYLGLNTQLLLGLFIINFNIKLITEEEIFTHNLRYLDLIDCNCSESRVMESLYKIFPKIHILKLVNVIFSSDVNIKKFISDGKFKNVRELHLENLAVHIPELLENIGKMPKLEKLTIIGNKFENIIFKPKTTREKIMFDLLQKKNSFTMEEVENELSKIDVEV